MRLFKIILKYGVFYFASLFVLSILLCSNSFSQSRKKMPKEKLQTSAAVSKIDPMLLGVWGVDARGGYEFKADGTFIMEGSVKYNFEASNGLWNYWLPGMAATKVTAEYKISTDGKSMSTNLKKGNSFTTLKKIR